MTLLAWLDDIEERFSYKEVQFKTFCLHVKTSYPTVGNGTLTVPCSVVKHAGSGRARKKCRGKLEKQLNVFFHSFIGALPLP